MDSKGMYDYCIPIPGWREADQIILRSPEDGGCGVGTRGYEKSNSPWRRQTIFAKFNQDGGAGGDFIATITGLSQAATPATTAGVINVFGGGSPSGTYPGDDPRTIGLTTGYNGGQIPRDLSNLYPGGMLCQPDEEYVVRSIGARVKGIFSLTTNTVTPKIYGAWHQGYQAQVQSEVLENIFLTFQFNRETCALDMEILANYPTSFSSGDFNNSSQNGEALRGNSYLLCKALPVGSEGGNKANAQLNANMATFTELLDVANPPPTGITQFYVGVELQFYGNCRGFCPVDYRNCLAPYERPPATDPRRLNEVPG